MNYLKSIVSYYLILTFVEWYIHRYLMHKHTNQFVHFINYPINYLYESVHGFDQTVDHVEHHSRVENDGSVKDEDKGMLFHIYGVPFITTISFILYCIASYIIGNKHSQYEYIGNFILFIVISFTYYFLWNILHPSYHNYMDNKEQYINSWVENNSIYKFLLKYHLLHHLNKGDTKYNFNIIIPGADYLFGTYKGCVDNTHLLSGELLSQKELDLCKDQLDSKELPFELQYC